MDIQDIKRLPAQLDSTQSRGPSQADEMKVQPVKSESVPDADHKVVSEPVKDEQSEAVSSPVQPAELEAAIDKMRNHAQNLDRELQFQVDSDTGRTVVTILNSQTQEVVRQIPSEEVLELTKKIEEAQGFIFSSRA